MLIKEELERRLDLDDDIYHAIGAEIKQHRLKLSKTLSNIANNNFSVSYLCKIERNQVKPSIKYLNQICEQINISKEKVDSLLNSKDILAQAIVNYYHNDLEAQKLILFKLEGLDNYRVILIRLICSLTLKKISDCREYIDSLYKLTSSLANTDLIIFCVFNGIYHYYNKNYIEAADYLKCALLYHSDIKYLEVIINGYLFACAYKTFSTVTPIYFTKLEGLKIKYGDNLNLAKAYYNIGIYYLFNHQERLFDETLFKLKDKERKSLINLENMLYSKNNEINLGEADCLCLAFYKAYNKSDEFFIYLDKHISDDVTKIYLTYLYLKNKDIIKAYDYLIDTALPYIYKYNISKIGYYFLEEIINAPIKPVGYKKMTEIISSLMTIDKMVNRI